MLKVKTEQRDSEIPSSSMADIAFLLLVFFLLITTIDIQKGLGNTLPKDDTPITIPPENITNILVRSDGAILVSNVPTELSDIKTLVEEKIKQNPLMIIYLKTQEQTKYKVFVHVLDQVKLAGAKKISIADPNKL